MKHLISAMRTDDVKPLTEAELRALAAAPRDRLQAFFVAHGPCAAHMADAVLLWWEDDELQGWCRKCGEQAELEIGDVPFSPHWWLVIAVVLLGAHRHIFTSADGVPTPAYHACLARLEEAIRLCVLLAQAGQDGRVH